MILLASSLITIGMQHGRQSESPHGQPMILHLLYGASKKNISAPGMNVHRRDWIKDR